MNYYEQLKHPLWQRRRLEILEAADFACGCCGNTEKTLHVHHKRYIKGVKVWEYEDRDLEALCEDCHSNATDYKKALDALIAVISGAQVAEVVALLSGYLFVGHAEITDEAAEVAGEHPRLYHIGALAGALEWYQLEELCDLTRQVAGRIKPIQAKDELERCNERAGFPKK